MRTSLSWVGFGLTLAATLPGCLEVPGRRDHVWLSVGQQGPTDDLGLPNTGLQVDDATAYGATYINVPESGGLGWELGLRRAKGSTSGAGATRAELSTWTFEGGGVWAGSQEERVLVPFAGGGWTLTRGHLQEQNGALLDRYDDVTLGLYVHGGVWARVSDAFGFGLDLRYVFGPGIEDRSNLVKLNQRLDHLEAAVFVSWSF